MPTNKFDLRTVEDFMSDYTPIYQAFYPLFLPRSSQYAAEVGKNDFRRINTVGDIRAKHITPKDTEMQQINVMEGKKSFKKYFLANQFQISQMQDRQGVEEVTTQVLDEHQVQMDELFLFGEGTNSGNVINNGLFYSGDSNYVAESSTSITTLSSLHTAVVNSASDADQVAGRKAVIFYGTDLLPVFNSIYDSSARSFKAVLAEVLGPNYSLAVLPKAVTPSGANGWITANLDQCKLHYTTLPQLLSQGYNEEKMYYWSNFMLGSCMLEVLAKYGVIHQPCTVS